MNGREVFKFATRVMVTSAQAVLERCDRSIEDVDVYVPHQANKRIIDYAVGKLGIAPEKTVVNVDRYGNTSSGSIPLALAEARADGRLTDGQGRTVDFRNTAVIMTSNLGSEFLASKSGALGFVAHGGDGFGDEKALRDRVMGKLRENMRPEFINRIDEIVLFRKLDKQQLRDIVRLLLNATESRLSAREITLTVTDAAVEWIADHGYEPEFGARPLRRVIQREVDDRVADLLVNGSVDDGGAVHVDASGDDLHVTAERRMPVAA